MSACELIAGNLGAPYGNRMPGHLIVQAFRSGRLLEPNRPEWGALFHETPLDLIVRAANECNADFDTVADLYSAHLADGGIRRADLEHLIVRWTGNASASLVEDINDQPRGGWRPLLLRTTHLIGKLESMHPGESIAPLLGGGAGLIKILNHRQTDNIDIFLDTPKWLRALSALRGQDEYQPIEIIEESSRVAIRFPEGEIRFILAPRLIHSSHQPAKRRTALPLERPEETIAKKLFYRGAWLSPVDLFDWRTFETKVDSNQTDQALAMLLAGRLGDIEKAISRMGRSPCDGMSWAAIDTDRNLCFAESIGWANSKVRQLRLIAGA